MNLSSSSNIIRSIPFEHPNYPVTVWPTSLVDEINISRRKIQIDIYDRRGAPVVYVRVAEDMEGVMGLRSRFCLR